MDMKPTDFPGIGFSLLRKQVRDRRPDIVQGWMYHGNFAALITAGDTPVVWNVRHSLYRLSLEKRLTQWLIRLSGKLSSRPKSIIYNSTVARRQHEAIGYASLNGAVVPNGLDVERWKPDPMAKPRLCRMLGISTKNNLIGHVARFHPMKGHQALFSAAKHLLEQKPDCHLILVGKGVEKKNTAMAFILRSLPEQQIHLLGERTDIESVMPGLDLLCVSSAWGEGFPNVLAEAMACGTPCVTTDVGDADWIVAETGWIVSPNNPTALGEALRHALHERTGDSAAWERRRVVCRERIEKRFGMKPMVEAYTGVWERALNEPRKEKG